MRFNLQSPTEYPCKLEGKTVFVRGGWGHVQKCLTTPGPVDLTEEEA